VPRATRLGRRDLILVGTPADTSASGGDATLDLGEALGDTSPNDEEGPRSVAALARRIAGIHRYDGVRLTFADPGERGGSGTKAYRDPDLRISGRVRARTFVTG
jgi:hypothetical protein